MTKQITAIICAMEEEAAAFRGLEQEDVRIIKSGVGKVHAAVATTDAIKQGATQVISVGYAGALLSLLDKGNLVLAIDAIQHDFDATALACSPSEIPFADRSLWMSDPILSASIVHASIQKGFSLHAGTFLSGDRFVTNRSSLSPFGGLCADMETAAIAHACHLQQIPWASIRIISDKADSSSAIVFSKTIEKRASRLADLARIIETALTTKCQFDSLNLVHFQV